MFSTSHHLDFKKAKHFFSKQKNQRFVKLSRKVSGLDNSYIKTQGNQVFRLLSRKDDSPDHPYQLGKGKYGRVKYVEDEYGNKFLVKVQIIKNTLHNKSCTREAAINQDVGLLLDSTSCSSKYSRIKAYQVTHYMGCSLSSYLQTIKADLSAEEKLVQRLKLAIDLLIQLHHLHQGLGSLSQKPYVHRDIKPDNIVVDEWGCVHFIDYGFSSEQVNELMEVEFCGSSGYLPCNPRSQVSINKILLSKVTRREADRFAALRTIYYPSVDNVDSCEPKQKTGIFNADLFKNLPLSVQELMDTANPYAYFESSRRHDSELFLAAVFITLLSDPKVNLTNTSIEELRSNPEKQAKLIADYRQRIEQQANQRALLIMNKVEAQLLEYKAYLEAKYPAIRARANTNQLCMRKYNAINGLLNHCTVFRSSPMQALIEVKSSLLANENLLQQHQSRFKRILNMLFGYFVAKGAYHALHLRATLSTFPSNFFVASKLGPAAFKTEPGLKSAPKR